MKSYYKIGDISKLYHIGVDSLRYYEELGLIQPQRSPAGYRLYSVSDIWRLNVIRELREIGFTMEQIGTFLDCHTTASTMHMLEEEQTMIAAKMQSLEQLRANVSHRMATIRAAQSLPLGEIQQVTLPCRSCYALSEGYQEEEEMDVLIKRLLNIDQEHLYIIGNNQIGTVIPLNRVLDSGKLVYQSVFIIDPHGTASLAGGSYLRVCYRGSYSTSAGWIARMAEYARCHGLCPAGDVLELLWIDIHTSANPEEHITELQLPVKEAAPQG